MSYENETNKFMVGQTVRHRHSEWIGTKECEHCGSELDVHEDQITVAKVTSIGGSYYPDGNGGIGVVYYYGLDNGAHVTESDLEAA